MNHDSSLWRRERHVVLLWLLGLMAALALLGAVTRQLGQQHLRGDAEATALRYAEVVAATVPGLEAVFDGRGARGETLDQLRRLRQVGEIFRFKLFDRQGRQVLVSDDLDSTAPAPPPWDRRSPSIAARATPTCSRSCWVGRISSS